MITLESCPICESLSITQFHQAGLAPHVVHEIMPGVKVDAAVISRYFVCQDCHVIFQNPRMSDEQLDKFYEEGYYRQLLNMTDEEKDNDEMYRAKLDSKIIKENLGEIKSHLDIGASRGYLLDKVGATLKVGVESNTDYVKVSGIEVYAQISQVPHKSFELVSAIHTLEHVPDPKSFLKKMIKLVDNNGYLVIEVPTWKSPGGPLRLPHLFHFEPDVLKLMCREAGLKVVHVEFTPHLLLICKLAQS